MDENGSSPKNKKFLHKMFMAGKGINNRVGCFSGNSLDSGTSRSNGVNIDNNQSSHLRLCCAVTDVNQSPAVNLTRTPSTLSRNRPLDIPLFQKASVSNSINGTTSSTTNGDSESSSKEDANNTKDRSRLRRKVLTQRRSIDNLIPTIPPSSPLRYSSPESSHSAPVSKLRSTTSHDTMLYNSATVSMDSLARQALLAAQVLHLIPTTKARERNYLQGRIAANSLLGATELERVLPNREARIFVGTWNMNGQSPPREINDFVLPSGIDHVPDILAIGTQESCSERFEWEVCLQETIGPSHVMLDSTSLGTLHLAIFVRRDLIWFCSICEDASMSVRPGTAFRTKGAVGIAFMLFGTSYLFVTAHLTAHQEKVKERVSDIKRIIRSLDLPKNLPIRHKLKGKKDVTQNFDCVFWFGDLNFRLNEPRAQVLQWIDQTSWPLPAHLPHGMLHTDQLKAVLSDGAAFKGFREAQITFPPTYKYDPGTQKFDSSAKQRTPAYTDRILFKCRSTTNLFTAAARRGSALSGLSSTSAEQKPSLECLIYDSVPSIVTSDHKPVWGVFKSFVRPGIDTIPLAAGLFNRDVYLEGIKRRAASLDKARGVSTICSIQ